MRRPLKRSCWAVLCVAGCVQGPSPAMPEGLTLDATDYLELPQRLDALPRRPKLRLHHGDGLAPDGEPPAYLLLAGTPNDALRDDLRRAPLRAEHALARVAVADEAIGDDRVVTPLRALEPDAEYVLAIPAWAKSRRGTPLTDGEPLLLALHTQRGDEAGARLQGTWPMDGASAVAPALQSALVAFDGRTAGTETGLWLEGPDGLAVRARVEQGPCAQLAPEQHATHCARLRPSAALAPDTGYAIVVGAGVVDAHGAPVGPARAEFRTGLGRDDTPPALRAPGCAVDEQPLPFGCALCDDHSLRVRSVASEAAIVFMRAAGQRLGTATAAGEVALRVDRLPSDERFDVELRALDTAGNEVVERATLRTTPPLAELSISEVLADPLGPEPHQEWVELLNYGEQTVDLLGFTLSSRLDAPGPAVVDAATPIGPHDRVLLVADGYDPADGRDIAPPPGARILRVGRALAGSGLSNTGVALFLRDAQGRRISAAPAGPRPRPGVCAVRATPDMRDGSEASFEAERDCSPGR